MADRATDQFLQALEMRYPDLASCLPDVERAYLLLAGAFRQGGKVLLCGNGGSAADCEHIVGELMKGFRHKRPVPPEVRDKLRGAFPDTGDSIADQLQGALPAIALTSQTSLISAVANDTAADMIFAQQVFGYGKPHDVLIGISTSGNSRNVLCALRVARALGLSTLGLTGQAGGAMLHLCDVIIRVPFESTSEVQERHLPIYHTLCLMLEEAFFPQ